MKPIYLTLLGKECRQLMPTAVAILVVLVAWLGFLYSRLGVWQDGATVGLAAVPLIGVPLWAMYRADSLRREAAGHHDQLLLMLPVPGWYLAGAKALAAWLEAMAYSLLISGVTVWFAYLRFWEPAGSLTPAQRALIAGHLPSLVLEVVVTGALTVALLVIMAQWGGVLGRLVRVGERYGLISGLAFLLAAWFLVRLATLSPYVLGWLPRITLVNGPNDIDAGVAVWAVLLSPAPMLAMLVGCALLFWSSAWLLDRVVEV